MLFEDGPWAGLSGSCQTVGAPQRTIPSMHIRNRMQVQCIYGYAAVHSHRVG